MLQAPVSPTVCVLLWGVTGIIHDPTTFRPLPPRKGKELRLVVYDDPLLRWTLAAREVVTLHGCTPST
jgi:hypothetical protein